MNLTDFPVPAMVSAALLQEHGHVVDDSLVARVACHVMEAAWPGPVVLRMGSVPKECGSVVFKPVLLSNCLTQLRALHEQHWSETEHHRHHQILKPDYQRLLFLEASGRYALFGVFAEGVMVGSCSIILSKSTHTQGLVATEDVLYISPNFRRGRIGAEFIGYVETALRNFGVAELSVTVKLINNAGGVLQKLGYVPVATQMTKQLFVPGGDVNVCT